MSDVDMVSAIRQMVDRQAIYDCLMRYCRGLDRFDRDLALSAYHPDAVDDHGHFIGPAEGFVDAAIALHTRLQRRTQHHITNHYCELEGDVAHAESYYIFRSLNVEAPWHSITSGRYLDRFERRDGRWAIAERICTVEIRNEHWDPDGDQLDGPYMTTSRDRNDPSYMRPLAVDRSRFT
jgi:hypothetical protein